MERLHGKGMVNLIDENGHLDHSRLVSHLKSPVLNGSLKKERLGSQIRIDGVDGVFDLNSAVVTFFGLLQGFSYDGVIEEPMTNCFVSGNALVDNIDNVIYIFKYAG